MNNMPEKLNNIRQQLDDIDLNIQQLINQRAELAVEIGNIKKSIKDSSYYRPEREAQILRKIAQRNSGPLDDRIVTQIFRTLMTACLALQQKIKVAFLGPEGTFSQSAALKHFGIDIETLPAESIEQVFHKVTSQEADYGVVPIENSTAGVIKPTLNALIDSTQQICGEIILPIHQHLLRVKSASQKVKCVYAHEQSLAQCKNWLISNLPDAEKIPVSSNGLAAKLAQQDRNSAAIAGDHAAEIYTLEKVAANIEDSIQNQTRFLVIGRQKTLASGSDKTTLLITTPHTPGALLKLIQPFAASGVNITWIESRPYQHHNWSYLFFLDIEGHHEEESVKAALQQLALQPIMLTILGSYPKAIL